MTSALSIMGLSLYKQLVARGVESVSIEDCEAMLRAAIDAAAGVGEEMKRRENAEEST